MNFSKTILSRLSEAQQDTSKVISKVYQAFQNSQKRLVKDYVEILKLLEDGEVKIISLESISRSGGKILAAEKDNFYVFSVGENESELKNLDGKIVKFNTVDIINIEVYEEGVEIQIQGF